MKGKSNSAVRSSVRDDWFSLCLRATVDDLQIGETYLKRRQSVSVFGAGEWKFLHASYRGKILGHPQLTLSAWDDMQRLYLTGALVSRVKQYREQTEIRLFGKALRPVRRVQS